MLKRHKIAVLGYGAIAQQLLQQLQHSANAQTYEFAVLLRPESTRRALVPKGVVTLDSQQDLLAWQADLVVEAAGQRAVHEYVPACLQAGLTVLISSIGALADAQLYAHLIAQAQQGGGRIRLPSGAIGALDYLRAASRLPGTQVKYESRKPVKAWQQELQQLGHQPDSLDQAITLFSGSADEAAQRYPQNLNVAAALALAGVGMEQTKVEVIADPQVSQNQHILHVSGPAGELSTHIRNHPSPENPKTSMLVAYSLLDAVERQFDIVGFA